MGYEIGRGARTLVVGYGSWATALVKILHENEPRTGWYIANPEVRRGVLESGRNPSYLSEVHFDREKLDVYDDINEAVDAADVVLLCVPSAYLLPMIKPLRSLDGKFVLSAIKGIVTDGYVTVAEYVHRRYGVEWDRIGILCGPTHSEEVAANRLTYITMVCKEVANAEVLCEKFRSPYIHANPATDIYGTEYAEILKNIYAICVGMALGAGYGDNFMAVLVSNAQMEMNRFLAESYPFERDTAASAYLGDLLVTCYSEFSRNRRFGFLVGGGKTVDEAAKSMSMVAEGYYAAACIRQVNKRFDIRMPIADCVYRVLYKGADPGEELRRLTEELY
jgi:glycerol-3-phosphate dehydrogenase (NAD(P)+)